MSNPVQFNFELPETEANRLLDVGVSRGMGLNRSAVPKSMVARALAMERLEQIAPTGGKSPELVEFFEKVQATPPDELPRILPKLEAAFRKSQRRAPAAA